MKKYIFSAFALALAIGFSAFSTTTPILTFDAAALNSSTVLVDGSYSALPPASCPGGTTTPCTIDIAGYADEAAFRAHLVDLADVDIADAIQEVKNRTVNFKN